MAETMMGEACMKEEFCEPSSQGKMRLLAHSYTPWQYYKKAFSPAEALMKGTLFPELYGVYEIPK